MVANRWASHAVHRWSTAWVAASPASFHPSKAAIITDCSPVGRWSHTKSAIDPTVSVREGGAAGATVAAHACRRMHPGRRRPGAGDGGPDPTALVVEPAARRGPAPLDRGIRLEPPP